MAANTKTIFQKAPKNGTPQTIVNADGTTKKTIYTAGAEGGLVDHIGVVSDDTADVVLEMHVNDGSTDYKIGEVVIPAGAGTDGGTTAPVNLLDTTLLPFLQSYGALPLESSWIVKVNAKSAVTAARTVTVVAYGGDY